MTVDLVTVTVDGREIRVPKGTGMIETALAAGIEIRSSATSHASGRP